MSTYHANRRYDELNRDQESRDFYKGRDWIRCRSLVLIRDNYLCQSCLKNKKITKADVVHHIKELKDYPELAYTKSNLVSWCHTCHNRHHKKGMKNKGKHEKAEVHFNANEELG